MGEGGKTREIIAQMMAKQCQMIAIECVFDVLFDALS